MIGEAQILCFPRLDNLDSDGPTRDQVKVSCFVFSSLLPASQNAKQADSLRVNERGFSWQLNKLSKKRVSCLTRPFQMLRFTPAVIQDAANRLSCSNWNQPQSPEKTKQWYSMSKDGSPVFEHHQPKLVFFSSFPKISRVTWVHLTELFVYFTNLFFSLQ